MKTDRGGQHLKQMDDLIGPWNKKDKSQVGDGTKESEMKLKQEMPRNLQK